MQALLDSVKSLSTRERKALAILLKRQGVNLYAVAPIAPRDPEELLVLSYAQQRQWFLWQLEPTSTAYNMPTALRLNGHLDVDALRASFETLIARHETLRTTFRQDGEQAIQVIHPSVSLPLRVEAVHLAPGQALEAALKGWVDAETRQPFDLEQGPLVRVKLLRLADDDHVLVFTLHHVVSDGWSTPVMVDELVHLYAAQVAGQAPSLPALPIQYADYALWQRQWMEAGEQERQLGYWTAQLGGEQPVLALPTDRAHLAMQDFAGASLAIDLDAELAQGLRQLAQQQGVTLFMLLLASFQTLLHRYSGQDDIRVGVPTANRNRVETERLIGFFVNTQVLKAEFDLHLTFTELLRQVRQTVLDAQAHQDLPFEQLVEALQPERSLSHSPLFQVMYNHQTQVKGQRRQLPGLSVEGLAWERHTAQFDLTLDTFESQDGIGAALTYATALFEPETIARLAAHWRNLLQAITRQPQQRIAELPMLDTAEHQQIVQDWNRTEADYPQQCLQQLVEAQVARTPDTVAVIAGEQPLSYRQLNERANRLAHHLRELGVGPDVLVGIAMQRSPDLVVAVLAVLKAGGAYVPLDPEYPRERVAYMMEDSQALLLLSQSSLQDRLPGNGQAKVLLLDHLVLDDYPSDNLPCLTTPENLAYNIYTSGSTGQPKGVQIEHRNAAALIGWASQVYSQQDLMGVLASTSICFDLSVWELFVTLSAGGYLVLADNALALGQLPARDQVHLVNTVPSAIKALLESGQLPASVRVVNLAGEPLKQSLVDALYATGHIQRVYDLYGPSEDTTYSTWTLRTAGGQANIGRPIANSAVYLLGAASLPVPLGSAGELCLSGAGLARGYLGRAALTAEKFLPDPFDTSAQGGGRLYRTGDLARYRTDGVIEYAGRIDHQVKIRGFRIELGEIAVRLLQHPALRDAVVIDTEGASGKQLVAYLVPAEGGEVDAQAIRNHLQATLPDYMVPAHLVTLDALPLTPNGKLDRKALPQPDLSQAQQAYVAPQTEVQAQLASIWAQVLKVPQVGLNDNFFELGGDSIVSIQVVSRARQAGIHFTPKQLFQHQTVQGLAAVARVGEQGGVQIDQGPVTGQALLLPIQQWFFEQDIPDRHHWNQSLLLIPGQRLEASVLEQALQALVAHHDALRLGFAQQDDGRWEAAYRTAGPAAPLLWQVELEGEQALPGLCENAQASLDLAQGPLLRAVLANLPDGSQRLLLAVHHLVVDGVSWRILLQDLQTAHGQLSTGQAVALAAKTSAGKAWAERIQGYANGDAQAELSLWREQLAGASSLLPCDNAQGSLQNRHAERAQTRLGADLTRKLLQQAPTAYRTQVNDLLLTALARVIARWTADEQVHIQLEGHGREDLFEDVDLTRTVGWFTSLYPVKLTVRPSVAESIKRVKEQLRTIPNKGIGFGALRYLGSEETRQALAQLPVPRITFNYLGQFDGSFAPASGAGETSALFTPAPESSGANQSPRAKLGNWLSINGQVYNGELNLGWTFSRDMFAPATIQRLADDYAAELTALVAHCVDEQAQGVTPSDFPLAALDQAQLDSLSVPAGEIEDIYPLSPMQQGMLFHALYERQAGHYINQMRVDVEGLDSQRFHQAWQQAVARHDVLRASFVTRFEQPLQVIRRAVRLPFVHEDWSSQPDLAQRLDAWAIADRQAGFDLHDDPLLRIAIIRTGPDTHHVIYTSHHILMDGWSNSQLLGEVLQRYAGQAPAQTAGKYREHIQWLGRQDRQASEAFWRQQLQPVEHPTRLANALRNGNAVTTPGQGDHYHVLDATRTLALSEFARQQRVTVNTLVQAAWLLLLQRYTGQDCVTFGATVSGRPADLEGVEQQLGLFINTLPVIASPRAEQSVAAWIDQVQQLNLALREHEHTPLYDIQRWAGGAAEGLFDTLLVFENYPVSEALQKGAPAGLVFAQVKNQEQTNYPMTLALGLGATLSMHFSYARAQFDDANVRQIAVHFDHLLAGLIADGQRCVGAVPMLDTAEHRQIVQDWNRTEADYPQQCLQQLVEAQVARTPDTVAVIAGEQPLSYRQLNERANRLAHHLRELGVGPDVLVGIAMQRSPDLVVAVLAVLKAGGAYVPLDPEYPRERVAYMMEDSQALLLLSQSSLQDRLPGNGQAKVLLLDHLVLDDYPSDNLPCLTTPENLAYNIYTSGSTGQPKGVQIEHRNAAALIGWASQVYSQQDLMGVLASTSICFDLSVWELFVTLSAGGYLVLADNALALGQLPARDQVHLVNTVPSAIKALLESGQLPASVRVVNLAGEPLKQSLVDALYATGHIQRVYDLYGPSEDTTYSTWTLRTAGGQANIGRPIANSAVYLLGAASLPVPLGSAGELCLSGAGLARGYLGRAALTAEKFLPDPFDTSAQGGGRLYRTGDLARYRTDGVIEYAGRIDHQVKIRGFRIELGEIAVRLLQHPALRDAVVIDTEGASGKQLVAYLVPAEGGEVDAQAIRGHLQATLPDYMVPAHLVTLDALPLTPNGKLDRKALPQPDLSQAQQAYVAPQTEVQAQLASIWAQVLKVPQVGLNDNFFELGGDSIVSIQVVSRARQAGIHFTPKQLFQHQTVQGLAAVARVGEQGGVQIDQGPVTGQALLLPIQQWFFEQDIPDRHHWNQSLLLTPGQRLEASVLEQALQALVAHHDALRLGFEQRDHGTWQAYYHAQGGQAEPLVWQAVLPEVAGLKSLCDKAQRSLALGQGPLIRAVLAEVGGDEQRLLLVIHHLVVDGVSWRILLQDLQTVYAQLQAGQPIVLPAKTSSTKAWAEHMQAHANSDTLRQEREQWASSLAGTNPELPCKNPLGSQQGRHAARAHTRLDSTLTRQLLQQAPAAYRTRINDLLLTALARVIGRWTERDDVLVQLEGHGREELFDDVDLTRTVGWFTSLYPVRLNPVGSMADSIKHIKEQLRAVPNQGIGFGALRYLGDTAAREALARLPVPRITFNYLGQLDAALADPDAGGVDAPFLRLAHEGTGDSLSLEAPLSNWLTLNGQVQGGELILGWSFSREVFDEQTIQRLADEYAAELALLVGHCLADDANGLTPSDVPLAGLDQRQLNSLATVGMEDIYPLSPMQQGMLFHSLYEQQTGSYINQLRVDVQGLDVQRFHDAWQQAVDAHDVLRARFLTGFEQALQVVDKQVAIAFSSQDWSGRADVAMALDTWAQADRRAGFDLHAGPLLRMAAFKIDDDRHHLVYTSHHILMDGWSNSQLLGEVLQRYAGQVQVVKTTPYRDYIQWLQQQDAARSEAFWLQQLEPLQAPTRLAPAMRQDKADLASGHGDHYQVLDAAPTQALADFARQQRVTVNTLVQAAWLLLLQRYTGQDCVTFGATVSGRPAELAGVEQQLGLFINTLPVIASPHAEQPVGDWLEQVQQLNLALREHEHTPLYEIQRWAGGAAEGLFDTLLVFENYPVSEALQQGAPAGLVFSGAQNQEQTNYPLTLAVGLGATLSVHYSYDCAHFTAASVQQLAGQFGRLLAALVEDARAPVGELPLLDAAAQRQIVQGWNRTDADYPAQQCLTSLIEAQVQRSPDAVALLFGEQRLSYGELNQRANRLAHHLRERGVGPDVLVGIAAERSLEMVVGLLAILKAGGAYVPLDPEYPQERLAYMIQDSGIALLLTQAHLQLPAADGVQYLLLEADTAPGCSDDNPVSLTDPANLAYVIYTSGSTGRPKGAGNSHRALVNRLWWMQKAYDLGPEDTVLQKTPFSFDVSVWEFFWPLLTGARLALAQPGDHRDPERLVETITACQVSTLHFVPSMLQAFLAGAPVERCQSLRRIVCSGEALPAEVARQTLTRLPQAGLYNLYGPTEAAIDVTHWTCQAEAGSGVPIGTPIDNLRTHVLDGGLQPVAAGMAAELYLGGVGLARGYQGRAALTAERFVPDPFDTAGGRLYRTGDLASYRADGVIEYAGRIDHQVKIRGLRIELGEIEAQLLGHAAVREAVVIDVDGPSGKQLAAYLVATGEADEQLREDLRTHLKAALPDYMVPTHLIVLPSLPLSANGKLDRKALPKPDASQLQREYVAPQGELETQLAAIWAQVLKVEKVGRTDNFFELGGDSIVSIQVVSRARQLNILFTPRALFEQQTVEALATVAKREAALAIEQSAVTGELPLTPVQRMFFERDIPARHHWNQSVLLQVNEPLLPEWVEKALQVLHTQHDVLRLGFAQQQGHWRAEHTAPGAGSLAQEVLWVRQATSQEHLTALCQQAQESLNLQQGPLLRALLVDMFDGSQRLLLVIHHLVVDGVSWRILLDDLQTACQAMARGATVTLPSKTTSFKAWAQRLEHHATGLQGQLAYWQAQLQDASDNLPRDRAQGGCQGRHAISVVTQLRRDDTERLLQQAPAAYRTQINDLLLTALSRVICRWTGQSSALVRLEGHGREDLFREVDITRTVGWFTSMYPVKLTPADSVADAIKGVKEQLRAVPDKGIGYGLLRYLGTAEARATLQALPQGEIVFNYLGQFDQSFDAQHGLFAPALEHGGAGQSPDAPLDSLISINGQVYAGELVLKWTFSREIFERSTLQRLADDYALELKAVIDHCVNGQATGVTPSDFPLARLTQAQLDSLPVPANDIADLYPLSPMQQGMLFHSLEDTQAGLYINQTSVPVSGLDARRFVEAWRQVVNYHDILRTSFHTGGLLGEPVQLVHRDVELEVNLLDWRGEADAPGGIERLIEADAHRAFDLARAPLMRLTLIELGEQRQHLIWTAHHVLLDGWSTSQLLGEVLARYAGQTVEQAPGRYRQYIDWLQRQDDDASEVFWRRHLQALDGPTLLSSAGAAPAQGLNGHAALYLNWDASRTARLHQCAQRLRVTPNTLVQATWLMLLQRYTGQETVCFGATVAGRPAALAGADKMLGLFINTVPVVQTPAPERRVASWLQALQHYNLEARDHEHTSLADIQRWGGQSGQALFDSIIVFENYPIDERLAQAGHQDVSFGKVKNRDVTNFAMDLAVHLGSTLSIEFLYLRNRFTEQATAQILACFQHLLQSLLDNPDACIGQLAMHPAVVLPITDPAPVRPSVAELISRQARLQPGAIAVRCAGQSLTYAQLEQRAEHLARVLRAQGVAAEARVGVAMERSVDTLVAFYAVLKAGGAFVPLDIDYPKERLQWIVQDASLSLLLSHSSVAGRLPPLPGTPYLEMDSLDLSTPCIDQAESAVSVDNLAYLIYTSGSTGLPKGVAVSHGPLSMHCQAIIEAYEMDASTRELHFMSFAFDGAQERWLSTLISGGQLVLRDSQLWTPEQTFQALHDHGITIACFPPAYLQQLAEHAATQPSAPPVRIYCFGGDAVADSTFERVKATLRPKYLTNGYGPTETVVTPLLWKAAAQEGCQAPIAPIGSAVGERTLYVLDAQLNLLPEGVAGELYIGGYGLARGYHERPGLSAERFVADPFSVGGRLYRTGDLVRRRADGVFDYLGRLDNQVKIRGFRIELGEVEACLRLQPQVRDAVVVAWDGGTGKQLIGYVVAEDSAAELPKHLRGEMQARLPDYMVPAQIIVLPAFPLSPNGKLDRKALPAPGQMGERDSFIAPRNELERQLAQVWSEVLGIERVGVTDNFFELGGDSLRSLKVISRVRALQLSGFELRLRDLMTRPTIADLSGYDEASAAVDPLLLLNRQVIGMAPLFCIHAGFGTVFDYEPLARRLDGQVSVYGLQCRMLLDPDWRDAGLRSMAADYAMHIRRKQPDGPYHLLGWSLGGTLAALVAHELECQGQRVASLSLVDSFIPQPPAVEAEQQSDWRAELVEFLQVLVPGHGKVTWESRAPGDLPDRVALANLIEAALAAPGAGVSDGSVQWSVEDLALGFSVAMHLKAVSRLPVELPSLQARARFLWADARNQEAKRQFESAVSPAGVHRQFDTDHYGMLKMPEVIEEVVVALAGSPDRVGG